MDSPHHELRFANSPKALQMICRMYLSTFSSFSTPSIFLLHSSLELSRHSPRMQTIFSRVRCQPVELATDMQGANSI